MPFYADLHLHSRYSRATSRDSDLEHLALWAMKKGITALGSGDFTHPAWLSELKEKLVPAEPGLFQLAPELESAVGRELPGPLRSPVRFMLSVEISTIYKKGDRTRKVHHLITVPGFESAERLVKSLSRIGNLHSDGRPILGLDSRDLLEITIESGEGCHLIPAHVWTPWFSALGSKSGFDSIEECYGDLASHIFALETGLSSDPPMNWRLSALDRFRLVSNSDAHSPSKLGRECCAFDCAQDYFSMMEALKTGAGYLGTVEFFPEEGKYHLDGHRKCNLRLTPAETREHGGRCPVCGKPVTIGVMNRVEELADRPEGRKPEAAAGFKSLVPLCEVLAECLKVGAASKAVGRAYAHLTSRLGPELYLLEQAPLEDLRRLGSSLLAEAVGRMRTGEVIREPGYDGEYGVIRLFRPEERKMSGRGLLFELPEVEKEPRAEAKKRKAEKPPPPATAAARPDPKAESGPPRSADRPALSGALAGLDPDQAAAARIVSGALLILAGPGTGKTRTLTHRLAHLIAERGAPPQKCLAITFTRRAAAEMRERLSALLPRLADQVPVMTFHALGLSILSEHGQAIGLPRRFAIAAEKERASLLAAALGLPENKAARLLPEISRLKRAGLIPDPESKIKDAFEAHERALKARALLDYDDLIGMSVSLLESASGVCARLRERFVHLSIDEYQDIDELQYRLIRLLAPPGSNLCAIGDPDQAIYSFRGADVRFFLRFQEDYPDAQVRRLSVNYRSNRPLLAASLQVIEKSGLERERGLSALLDDPSRIVIHEAASERAEAEFVVKTIERMIGGHSFFSLDSGRAGPGEEGEFSFSDFAALFRMEAQRPALEEAFARSGMPFMRFSHERLGEDPLVERLVEPLRARAGQGSVFESLQKAKSDLLAAGATDFSEAELERTLELLRPLAEACRDDGERFLSELALGARVDLFDPRADRVSLLTMHAAKGLEFRVVFMVGCEDGIVPLRFGAKAADLDEERRLFYVGMTRSRERLFLCHARKRALRGKVKQSAVSPFVLDIEESLLERMKGKSGGKPAEKSAEQLDLF